MAAAHLEGPELESKAIQGLLAKGAIDLHEALSKHLWDGRTHVRRNAALALALADELPEDQTGLLAVAGKDTDPQVRLYICQAFGNHEVPSERCLPTLIRGLVDDKQAVTDVALSALSALIKRKEPATLKAIVEALGDRRPFLQVTAADLLLQLGEDAVLTLIEALRHPSGSVRKHAGETLQRLGGTAAPAMIQALADDDIRDPIKHILHEVDLSKADEKALEKMLSSGAPVVQMVAKRLLDGASAKRVQAAAHALEGVPQIDLDGFYEGVLDGKALQAAAKAVDTFELVRALVDTRDTARINAANLLRVKGLGDDGDVLMNKLAAAAKDDLAAVRAPIIATMATAGGETAADRVAMAVLDNDVEVRKAAMEGIAVLAVSDTVHVLDSLGSQVPEKVRSATARALAGAGAKAVPVLAAALDDMRESIRVAAAEILGKIGTEAVAAVPQLVEAVHDDYEDTRVQAVIALGKVAVGAKPALVKTALEAAIAQRENSSFALRAAASKTVALLQGKSETPRFIEPRSLSAEFSQGVLDDAALKKLTKDADPPTLGQLLFDGRKVCRINAARALALNPKAASGFAPQLCVSLKDEDTAVRIAVAGALAVAGADPETAVQALVAALKGARQEEEDALIAAIESFGKKAVAPIVAMLTQRPELVVPTLGAAARRLPKLLVKPIADALSDESVNMIGRENAADALAELGEVAAEAEKGLLAALEDRSVLFRVKLIGAIGKTAKPTDAIRERLEALAEDDQRISILDAIDDAQRFLRSRRRLQGK